MYVCGGGYKKEERGNSMRERMKELRYQVYLRRLKGILASETQSRVSDNRNRDNGKGNLFEGNSIAFEIKGKKILNGNIQQE